jgi:hypothetical protein
MSERFETMTVIELRDYAREHHIPLPAGINKQGIIDKLKASVQPEAAAEESGTPAEEPKAPAPAARPRTASIIADDSDYDYEDGDLSYRQPPRVTPQPTYTQRPAAAAPARPAEPARPAAAKPDVLSTISSKAPAFNLKPALVCAAPSTVTRPSRISAPARERVTPARSAETTSRRSPSRSGATIPSKVVCSAMETPFCE